MSQQTNLNTSKVLLGKPYNTITNNTFNNKIINVQVHNRREEPSTKMTKNKKPAKIQSPGL